jgi:hypothetical protein
MIQQENIKYLYGIAAAPVGLEDGRAPPSVVLAGYPGAAKKSPATRFRGGAGAKGGGNAPKQKTRFYMLHVDNHLGNSAKRFQFVSP